MTRDELISRTRQLIDEGDRLQADPSMGALQLWLQLSDDLLATAWGSMDRYHLAWLMVGKPATTVRGRPMTEPEEATYVRAVAAQKTAALRMSLDAVERQGMPFRGEDAGMGAGRGMGRVPGDGSDVGPERTPGSGQEASAEDRDRAGSPSLQGPREIPVDEAFAERLAAARRRAAEHADHGIRRAPRPEKMQR
jgi:hypothetical protein